MGDDRRSSWGDSLWSAFNQGLSKKNQFDPRGNYSFDWCRFRRRERCYYPKELNEEATAIEGYSVWVPSDRGFCPRAKWDDQRACPMAEPGPNSGEPNSLLDATVPYEGGGQRGGVPVQVGARTPNRSRRSPPGLDASARSDGHPNIATQLAALAELHTSGSLTDDEFAKAKAQVLAGTDPDPGPGEHRCDHHDSTSRTFCTTCGADL